MSQSQLPQRITVRSGRGRRLDRNTRRVRLVQTLKHVSTDSAFHKQTNKQDSLQPKVLENHIKSLRDPIKTSQQRLQLKHTQ